MNEETEVDEVTYFVGDVVEYLPHVCHAFTPDPNNRYPWVIGMKQNPRYEENPNTGARELVEDIVEIDEGRLHREVLPHVGRGPNPTDVKGRLVPLRPRNPWAATVTAVHPGGRTVDLDVDSNVGRGMITLHYARVPVDEAGMTPHTCRKKEAV